MNSERPRILMVEDEQDVLRINARILGRRGYEVLTAASCGEACAVLAETTPDLLLLDVMLPDGSGFDICRRFRERSDHPVIFLTGKNQLTDRIDGLDQGGDYYITKPCDPDELLAIVGRLMQRHLQTREKNRELSVITRGQLVLDIPRARALVNGADVGLTTKEFALLRVLMLSEGQEVSPHELYEQVWGAPSVDDVRTIRTHMKNLRRKLDAQPRDFDIISAYGRGYTFTTSL